MVLQQHHNKLCKHIRALK
ncbi:hypothetical protein A2U01_0063929, partial [Trifolium medium]|nr:hypothetical protein [Trifolium medium]